MTSPIPRALAAGGFACILSLTLACRHKAVSNPIPATAPPPRYPDRRSQKPEMPDDFVRWRSGLQFARLLCNNSSTLT
jgi:hypothetical protein